MLALDICWALLMLVVDMGWNRDIKSKTEIGQAEKRRE